MYKPKYDLLDDLISCGTLSVCYVYKKGNDKPLVLPDLISFKIEILCDKEYLVLTRKLADRKIDTYICFDDVEYFSVEHTKRGD